MKKQIARKMYARKLSRITRNETTSLQYVQIYNRVTEEFDLVLVRVQKDKCDINKLIPRK